MDAAEFSKVEIKVIEDWQDDKIIGYKPDDG